MSLSPIFDLAERFVDEQAALDPCLATARGIPGHDDQLTDFSPHGHEQRTDHLRQTLATVAGLDATNDDDRLAKSFITERFEATLMFDDAGEWKRAIRAIAAPTTVARSTLT
jgi:uncharacterized protein (DUF885 family)